MVSNYHSRLCESTNTSGAVPMFRRLEDRIRELCATAVTAEEPELEIILSQLQSALREHTERLRRLAAAKLTTLDEDIQQERRAI